MNYPQQAISILLDMLFPPKCINCHIIIPLKKGYICSKCLSLISIKKDFECLGCRLATPFGKTCNQCQKDFRIDNIFIVASYREPLVSLIKTIKYRFVERISIPIEQIIKKYLIWLFEHKFSLNSENPIISPVPLHYRRYNWRGFNQAEIIAELLASKIQCHMQPDLLIKKNQSKPQADISEHVMRYSNINGCFSLSEEWKNKITDRTIILVDDVCTTGATLNECAQVLKKNGAKKVIGFVIARG